MTVTTSLDARKYPGYWTLPEPWNPPPWIQNITGYGPPDVSGHINKRKSKIFIISLIQCHVLTSMFGDPGNLNCETGGWFAVAVSLCHLHLVQKHSVSDNPHWTYSRKGVSVERSIWSVDIQQAGHWCREYHPRVQGLGVAELQQIHIFFKYNSLIIISQKKSDHPSTTFIVIIFLLNREKKAYFG